MPRLIPHDSVLPIAAQDRLRCVYHHGGAFEFVDGPTLFRGWLTRDDPTVRPELRAVCRLVVESELIHRLLGLLVAIGNRAMILPTSHWAHELDAHPWLGDALAQTGTDASVLRGLNEAAAVGFDLPGERASLDGLLRALLAGLDQSDFTLLVPGVRLMVTLHHHRQVWWRTTNPELAARIDLA
jgi:hypothetical protein